MLTSGVVVQAGHLAEKLFDFTRGAGVKAYVFQVRLQRGRQSYEVQKSRVAQ